MIEMGAITETIICVINLYKSVMRMIGGLAWYGSIRGNILVPIRMVWGYFRNVIPVGDKIMVGLCIDMCGILSLTIADALTSLGSPTFNLVLTSCEGAIDVIMQLTETIMGTETQI